MSLPSTSASFTGRLWCIASDTTWRRSADLRASSKAPSRMLSAAGLGRAHPLSDDASAQLNASILATAGMKLAPLLSVIRRSYLKRPPALRRHCPPTNGVFATFLTGSPPQATVPTIAFRQRLEATRIEEPESVFAQLGRQRLSPRVGVRVVGEDAADDTVRLELPPHADKGGNGILETPEEVIGPFERLVGLAASHEEPGLPRRDRGNARDLVELALVRYRIVGSGSCAHT